MEVVSFWPDDRVKLNMTRLDRISVDGDDYRDELEMTEGGGARMLDIMDDSR
jgi:hypothetical protein